MHYIFIRCLLVFVIVVDLLNNNEIFLSIIILLLFVEIWFN